MCHCSSAFMPSFLFPFLPLPFSFPFLFFPFAFFFFFFCFGFSWFITFLQLIKMPLLYSIEINYIPCFLLHFSSLLTIFSKLLTHLFPYEMWINLLSKTQYDSCWSLRLTCTAVHCHTFFPWFFSQCGYC